MDTKTLVVGQEVYLISEVYMCRGKVVEVTPEGVIVQATVQSNLTRKGDLLRFDKDGKGRDEEGTHECGAWQLVNSCEQEPTAESYRPIKGSAVAASMTGARKAPVRELSDSEMAGLILGVCPSIQPWTADLD